MIVIKSKPLSPALKWAGGKEKELKYIIPNLPKDKIDRYIEPFVGGGAVYFALETEEMYINDKSIELTNLYKLIKNKDKKFLDTIQYIYNNWIILQNVIEHHKKYFIDLYTNYSMNNITLSKLEDKIMEFVIKNSDEFNGILSTSFNINIDNFLKEIKSNLLNKIDRMNKIEKEKGKLSIEDLIDNIECAFKSALYMHFRFLYNNIDKYNLDSSFSTALFFFIREYCYASMFRYNKNGKFNVPYGGISYNRKDFQRKIDYLKSKELIEHLRKTNISNCDFEEFLYGLELKETDFIFLDPPYDSDFSTYAKNEFTKDDQRRLASFLYNTNAKFMMVIKNTEFIRSLYDNKKFNIKTFDKKYLVSFQDRNHKNAEHLIITNY